MDTSDTVDLERLEAKRKASTLMVGEGARSATLVHEPEPGLRVGGGRAGRAEEEDGGAMERCESWSKESR